MTAKEFLQRAYRIDLRIRSKSEQIERLNDLATRCTIAFTGMPKNPSPSLSPMEDAVVKIIDLENEIKTEMERLVDIRREISDLINRVDNDECRLLLEKRYLCFYDWNKIAKDLGYTLRHIYRLHGRALEICDEILKVVT